MGGVLQTIKFLSAAAGVGLCLNGMDKLAQRIDECVFFFFAGRKEADEEKRKKEASPPCSFLFFASELDLLCSFEHASA